MVGTLRMQAPELLRGRPATPASDLYAFGVVLYEMFAGRSPLRAAQAGSTLSQAIAAGDHVPLGELRPELPPGPG